MNKKLSLILGLTITLYGLANAQAAEHDHALPGNSAGSAPTIGIPSGQNGMDVVIQTLVQPPFVPVHEQSVRKQKPKVIHVDLSIEEKKFVIAPAKDDKPAVETWGMFYRATSSDYVSTNPGPTIVVHQNDVVEVHLINPTDNLFAHNIDFHGATGAMGGGSISLVSPGEEVTFRFLASKAVTFIDCRLIYVVLPLYFPIQKLPKISPNRSSEVNSPVISDRLVWACLRSSATSSGA